MIDPNPISSSSEISNPPIGIISVKFGGGLNVFLLIIPPSLPLSTISHASLPGVYLIVAWPSPSQLLFFLFVFLLHKTMYFVLETFFSGEEEPFNSETE